MGTAIPLLPDGGTPQADDRLPISRTPHGVGNNHHLKAGSFELAGVAAAAVAAHAGLPDPHPGYLTAAEGAAAYQPLDSDLTAIAALATTAFGRSFLELANSAAALTLLGGLREVLTANRTYYVRTDGSNSNSGLINTAGGAFLTPQFALDYCAANLDFHGKVVTIQIGDGTYTGAISIPVMVGQSAPTSLVIVGNSVTPTNVVLTHSGGFTTTVRIPAFAGCYLQHMRIQNGTASGYCITAEMGGVGFYIGIDFGTATCGYHLHANGGVLQQNGTCTVSGDANAHFGATTGGRVLSQGRTITAVGGTRSFAYAFAYVEVGAQLLSNGNTFNGTTWTTASTKYNATMGGIIQTYGSGINYFPGLTASGTTSLGGQYA